MAVGREEIQVADDIRKVDGRLASISLIFWECDSRTVTQHRSAQAAASLRQHG